MTTLAQLTTPPVDDPDMAQAAVIPRQSDAYALSELLGDYEAEVFCGLGAL